MARMNKKTYELVISGKSDNNIMFSDFQNLIIDLGFVFKHQEGSHMVYMNRTVKEIMNIQSKGSKAKDYQVRQLRKIIRKHNL